MTPAVAPTTDDLIKDTTTAAFRQDVLLASMDVLVLVDFWAPWCGPCRQLTPILEKAVRAAKGRVRLVKMNIDQHPQIAGQLGVKSIPAVFAFDRGQPVDGFMGALGEAEVRDFIDRLIGPSDEVAGDEAALLAEAQARLDSGDAAGAAERFAALLAAKPDHAEALGGFARAQVLADNLDVAQGILGSIPETLANHPAISGARAALDLAEAAAALGDIGSLEAKVQAGPQDHQARFDLALALNARGRREEATDHLLAILRKDRAWQEDAARKQLLTFFEAWGPEDEATRSGRRKLSAALFA